MIMVSKGAKIRNRYNQVPHLTKDTNGKKSNSQLDTTNESQEVSPFPAGDHKPHMNRHTQRHCKRKTEQKHKRSSNNIRWKKWSWTRNKMNTTLHGPWIKSKWIARLIGSDSEINTLFNCAVCCKKSIELYQEC